MSYEGFESWLCKQGHYHSFNCYDTPDPRTWRCPHCGSPVVAARGFDCTNGCYTHNPETGDPEYPCPYYNVEMGLSLCGQDTLELVSGYEHPSRYRIPDDWRLP